MSESHTEERLVCRVSIPVPPQCPCYKLMRDCPDLNLEVQGCLPLGNGLMIERIRTRNPPEGKDLSEVYRDTESVKDVKVVLTTRAAAVHDLKVPLCAVIQAHEDLNILPTYPFHLKDGVETLLVASTRERVRNLLSELQKSNPGVTIHSISHRGIAEAEALLTPRQADVFRTAMSSGYWDVPRRASLTDLATVLNVAKSTLHETIAQIENRLLHEVREEYLQPVPF